MMSIKICFKSGLRGSALFLLFFLFFFTWSGMVQARVCTYYNTPMQRTVCAEVDNAKTQETAVADCESVCNQGQNSQCIFISDVNNCGEWRTTGLFSKGVCLSYNGATKATVCDDQGNGKSEMDKLLCDSICGTGQDKSSCLFVSDINGCSDNAWRNITRPTPQPSTQTLQNTNNQDNTGPVFNEDLTKQINGLNQFQGKSISQIIGIIIKTGMGMIGAVALIIFVYGGIIWMLARGNATEQEKAFETILWAGLGVAVIFASYALVDYIFGAFK